MDKHAICEAMYALPGDVVVKHRKPLLIPAVLLLAGVAILVLNNVYEAVISVNLRSAAVFIGGVMAFSGACVLLTRLFSSKGAPFHKGAKCYLRYEELYFEPGVKNSVVQHLAEGKAGELLAMPHAQVPSVTVAMFRTPDNRFAAMRAFEYVDLEYRPLTELKIVGD